MKRLLLLLLALPLALPAERVTKGNVTFDYVLSVSPKDPNFKSVMVFISTTDPLTEGYKVTVRYTLNNQPQNGAFTLSDTLPRWRATRLLIYTVTEFWITGPSKVLSISVEELKPSSAQEFAIADET